MLFPGDATLTKTQKNRVFRLVSNYKFDHSDIRWAEVISEEGQGVSFTASTLTHVPTEYYFTFGEYRLEWSPGRKTKVEREGDFRNWDRKVSRFEDWLHDLREEVDAPDMWAIAFQHKKLAEYSLSPDEDNRPFSKGEQEHISKRLQEIKRFIISTQNLNAEKLRAIETKLDYINEATERLGRKDWLMIFIGLVYTSVIAATVTPDGARELFKMIAAAFMPLFQSFWQLEG